ncbi:MAG: hypothetical protein JSS30_04455 [Verrucomicrobia bacterium]|nr:hypothetical protein [Verrucomicrobiota bacterium]
MEHPHDPYHVRPFPQQPNRGGKQLTAALADLESALSEKVPNLEKLRAIQARIHNSASEINDDLLVDMLRQISEGIDKYGQKPGRAAFEKIIKQLMKLRIELKHL